MKPQKKIPRSIWAFTVFILKEVIIQKRYLLLPLWILLFATAILILLGGGSSLLPAIYIAL